MGLDNRIKAAIVISCLLLIAYVVILQINVPTEEERDEKCHKVDAHLRPGYQYCIKEISGVVYRGFSVEVDGKYKFLQLRN